MTGYALSPQLSYRTLADVAIVVDHRRGEISKLNRAAGRVLDKLAAGASELDDEEAAFAESLVDRGWLWRPVDAAIAPTASLPAGRQQQATAGDREGAEARRADLIDRLNDHAAELMVPLHCQLELTTRCPLSCRYCYLHPERSQPNDELRTAEVTRLLDDLADLGGLFLLLTGGEILLRSDLEAIVTHARALRFAVSLLTSGWQLAPALARRLAAGGLDSVQVSLHGAEPATHDAMTRVSGSFVQALGALRLVRDLGVSALAAITVTKRNHHSLGAMLELCRRESVIPNVSFYVQPLRGGSREPQSLLLDEDELREALQLAPPQARARMAGRELLDRPCGAGASAIAVGPEGTVYPCHSLRIPVGSIRESPLATIWRESAELERVRGVRVLDLDDCPRCEARTSCNRCVGFAVAEGGSLTSHGHFDCLSAHVIASRNKPKR